MKINRSARILSVEGLSAYVLKGDEEVQLAKAIVEKLDGPKAAGNILEVDFIRVTAISSCGLIFFRVGIDGTIREYTINGHYAIEWLEEE